MTPLTMHAASRLLASEIGTTRSSNQIAIGTANAGEKLFNRLAPLVGEAGIRSLFDRGLTVNRKRFPWLADAIAPPSERPWTHLRAAAEHQAAETAFEASVCIFATVIGLLERLIGQTLTARLLHDVWPEVFAPQSPREAM